MFGGIVDRTNLKGGKFLPWLRLATFLVPLFMLIMFLMPANISSTAKIVWGGVTYILYGMAYTICDVPSFSMTSAITDQVHERIRIMSINSIVSGVALLVVTISAPQLYLSIGWPLTAFAISIPAMLFMLPFVRIAKERYINKDSERVTFKVMARYVKDNKYLQIYFIALIIMNITNTTQTAAAYFAANNLGDESMTSLLIAIVAVPALIVAVFLPSLAKRVDRFHIFLFSAICNGVLCVVSFFAGYRNFTVFMVFFVFRGLFMGAVLVTQLMFTGDIVEYGEYKTGKRLQGTAYSIQTFTFKLFNAVAAATAMLVLGAFGFVEGGGVIQSAETQNVIWVLLSLFPAFGLALSLPLMFRYKLRDKDVQLMAKVNSGEMPREEAEKLFINKY
jgi:Na+/melibiose symporter-like transporter